MDSGSDKYLHKKFKKQLSVAEPKYDNDKETKATLPIIQEKNASQVTVEDNKNSSVPNQSTNRTTSPMLAAAPPLYSVYRSSISKVDEQQNDPEPQSTITCISYGNATDYTENIQNRPVNFDRNCSVSEPIVDDDTRTDQSSILENVSKKLNDEKDHYQQEEQKPQENNQLSDKTGGGKHVCPYCNLACSKPSVLQKHIRAHTNERPYPCNSCGFSFKTRSNLYKHCRSRTHANRVMGNKLQEIVTEMEVEPKSPPNQQQQQQRQQTEEVIIEEKSCQEQKSKPYKPRFHTAKAFFDTIAKENVNDNEKTAALEAPKRPNSDLLSIRINEVISKNNSIVNSTDPYLLKRRSIDAYQDNNNELSRHVYNETNKSEEPLNLTKNRKRCMSEVTEPAQKSLIKELLLKNLYADTNMQCPYCKMIFQTVTELELHKLRSCKGFTNSARYNRSSSVNVASILTQNKNAFDSLAFPLKSPGPFLGKTRLVESDKNKSFSFDDNLAQTSLSSGNDFLRTSQRYALSPLTIQSDREKKQPVKLFGGEVKIAHTSGETKSFKIDGKEDQFCGGDSNYMEFSGKLSENRVVKSTLQSGGTVLTNKPAYTKQDSPDVIRVYENNSNHGKEMGARVLEKGKFNFENQAARDMIVDQNKTYQAPVLLRPIVPDTTSESPSSYKYTNIMDFSQKAAKMLTPNLKQLNLTIPGIPIPTPAESNRGYERMEVDQQEEFVEKPQKMIIEPQSLPLYNPVNLLVNGKVIRYVPGIPGPICDTPFDIPHTSISTNRVIPSGMRLQKPNHSPLEPIPIKKLPVIIENEVKHNNNHLHIETAESSKPSPEKVSPSITTTTITTTVETRKFARPNSLALKPSLAANKTHHGLTPTVFNQVLISPDTPRVAKKYNQHMIHGNYFTYLELKKSTKLVYCTLNKTQPVYVPHFKKLSMYSEWRQQEDKSDKLYASAYDSRQKQQKFVMAGRAASELMVVHSSYKVR